ncbi:MAG: type II toxin-antitoxin system mRNA interferase toxin, RelE/StbE family [Archaeoglobaceae archaeon]
MSYRAEFSEEFLRIAKKLKDKDPKLFERLMSKIEEIIKQPEHYKPLKGEMKGLRKAHIGHFVVIFN